MNKETVCLRTHRGHICSRENDPTLREGEGTSQGELSSFKIMLEAGKEIFREGEKANVSRKERSRKAPGLESMHLRLGTDKTSGRGKTAQREEGANPF